MELGLWSASEYLCLPQQSLDSFVRAFGLHYRALDLDSSWVSYGCTERWTEETFAQCVD